MERITPISDVEEHNYLGDKTIFKAKPIFDNHLKHWIGNKVKLGNLSVLNLS
ncbi:MAG: hypothetical protein QXT72_02075 [Candidatus Micrarchaeia archaeon]